MVRSSNDSPARYTGRTVLTEIENPRVAMTNALPTDRFRSGSVTTGSNNPMASRTQCSGQPASDESCGAGDEDDHER